MTLQELITDIRDEVTFSGMLPYTLNEREINRIITNATRYFWDNWKYAVEPAYLVIPLTIFQTQQFRDIRQIILPDCVAFVNELKEIKGGSIFGTIDRDFTEQKFIGSEIFLTPFMGESMVYRSAVFSFLDLTKAFIIDTIAHVYNKNTRTLYIQGRTPATDVVAQIDRKIALEYMYNDEYFQRYVRAKSIIRLGQQLKAFTFKLPGGVEINYKELAAEAQTTLDNIIIDMRAETTPSFMLVERW
jgi:hypothetical protein